MRLESCGQRVVVVHRSPFLSVLRLSRATGEDDATGDEMIRHEQTNEPQPLLRPVELGDLRLPNRLVMAPLTRCRAANDDLAPTDLHAAYYGQRAGAGLIIAEGAWVSERAIGFPRVPGIHRERHIEAWRGVTDLVHALGGRIVLQLWHTGAGSHPDHLGGALPAGPSAIDPGEICPTPYGRKETVTPREMTVAEIETTVADYAAAAGRAPSRVRRRRDRRQRDVPDRAVPQPAAQPAHRRVRNGPRPAAARDRRRGDGRLGRTPGRRTAVAVLDRP
jgi:hypothetical protein